MLLCVVQCEEIGRQSLVGVKFVKLEILSTSFIDLLYDVLGESVCVIC